MNKILCLLSLSVLILLGSVESYAQKYKERSLIRSGNDLYEEGNYVESEVSYLRALDKVPKSLEASYNMAGSLYKQERFKEATEMYETLAKDPEVSSDIVANTLYNAGNTLFKQRELDKALESYKASLRLNPNDMEAKFNLAYTQKLIEEGEKNKDNDEDKEDNEDGEDGEDNEDGEDKENKDNKDDKDNKDSKDQEDNQDQKDKDQEQDKQQDQQKPENKDGDKEENKGKIDKQNAEQMLNAVQMEEDKTREKLDAKKAKVVGRSGKNW